MEAERKPDPAPEYNLNDAGLFINREVSWLKFNERVLEEAEDQSHPLLERVKFLAIFAANLDEFFMVRVSGLRRLVEAGIQEAGSDALTVSDQLVEIRKHLLEMLPRKNLCWQRDLLPKLRAAGVFVLDYRELHHNQKDLLRRYFEEQIYPILTPLAFDPAHPFPHISNLSLNLAVVIDDPQAGERFARIKIPEELPRSVPIPDEEQADCFDCAGLIKAKVNSHVWLEQVIMANLDLLFPGLNVAAAYVFRITRDADLEIEEDEAGDLLSTIEERVEDRDFGHAVRIELGPDVPERISGILIRNLKIAPYLVYSDDNPVGMADLWELVRIDRPDLRDPWFIPNQPAALTTGADPFAAIRRRDLLLYHPYDSFMPVVDFIRAAAADPNVLAIKMTLYRVGPSPPVVEALKEARWNKKQVAVLVELKARFDEENNIAWARALEFEGVHVIYGVLGLKTHAKMCLVVRREPDGIVRYLHLSTGNYNTVTSRIYTDLGLFTADRDIAADASDLFNALTGYSRKEEYRKLLVAPVRMRREIIARIDREIERHRAHGDGRLAFKINALVDKKVIKALYRASQAGVKIDLQVRGICCLRPGLPGLSENITVTSIVSRFLEHSRIYYFRNGGQDEVLLGSADLMPRNLDRRVEILYPIEDPVIKRRLIERILATHLADTAKARRLNPDGTYQRVQAPAGQDPLNSQLWMIEHLGEAE